MKVNKIDVFIGVIIGLLLHAAIVWAGSYSITVATSASTDTLFPIMVAQYNKNHGTSYTNLQYAQQLCSNDIEGKTQQWLLQLGQ